MRYIVLSSPQCLVSSVQVPGYLDCLVYVESQADGVAEEEDDDDGEEHGSHGGVPAVALGDGVVNHGGSEKSR